MYIRIIYHIIKLNNEKLKYQLINLKISKITVFNCHICIGLSSGQFILSLIFQSMLWPLYLIYSIMVMPLLIISIQFASKEEFKKAKVKDQYIKTHPSYSLIIVGVLEIVLFIFLFLLIPLFNNVIYTFPDNFLIFFFLFIGISSILNSIVYNKRTHFSR